MSDVTARALTFPGRDARVRNNSLHMHGPGNAHALPAVSPATRLRRSSHRGGANGRRRRGPVLAALPRRGGRDRGPENPAVGRKVIGIREPSDSRPRTRRSAPLVGERSRSGDRSASRSYFPNDRRFEALPVLSLKYFVRMYLLAPADKVRPVRLEHRRRTLANLPEELRDVGTSHFGICLAGPSGIHSDLDHEGLPRCRLHELQSDSKPGKRKH